MKASSISASQLRSELAGRNAPIVIDVRRRPAFMESDAMISGALRREPGETHAWAKSLPSADAVVVYCVHGHEVSQGVAAALSETGIAARYLEGGFEGWKASEGALDPKPRNGATRWVTRERPKIDRIACPWLIRRFVDPRAAFLFVAPSDVVEVAERFGGVPFDIENVFWSHRGDTCTFDTMIEEFALGTPPLLRLATMVRGADTARPELSSQAPGLLAASLGLSRMYSDDLEQLEAGMLLYDALYRWCRDATDETHNWPTNKPRA